MTKMTRDQIREQIFRAESMLPKTKAVSFFGADIEVRQPDVETILDYRDAAAQKRDTKEQMVQMLITYCYVPGTDEKVFEEGDADSLLKMPFGGDFTRLQVAMSELSDVKLVEEAATKNSEETVSQ